MRKLQDSYRYFVEGFVKQTEPKIILEIGLGNDAYTAEGILNVISNIEDSKYYVIEKTPTEVAKTILKKYPSNKWELLEGDSGDERLYEKFSNGIDQCNLVLIDGDHSHQKVYSDIQMCISRNVLKYDGYFIFHDVNSSAIRYSLQTAVKDFHFDYFIISQANLALVKYKLHR